MTRVLLGEFGPLCSLGYREFLAAAGVEIVEASGVEIVQQFVEALPDVVLLDGDAADSDKIVGQIVLRFPSVMVITCSSVRPTMRIFPPRHYGESYTTALEPALLTSAIQA